MIRIERIIAQALRDPASFAILRTALTNSLAVANPHYRRIVEWACTFWDTYRVMPRNGDWEFWLSSIEGQDGIALQSALGNVINTPVEDWTVEYISTEVSRTLQSVAQQNAIARLGTMVPDVPPGALEALAEEVKKIEPVTIAGLKAMAEVDKYFYSGRDFEVKCRTGIHVIDEVIGGLGNELVFIMGDSNVGKSSALIRIGANIARQGHSVLHLTFELSAENTLRRYYRSVSESTPTDVRSKPELVIDRVKHWLRFVKGSVHVLFQPAYTIGQIELEAIVDQYIHIYGPLDCLILDYLDLMKPSLGVKSEYEGLGKLSHGVRGHGVKNNYLTLSAAQATRGSGRIRHLRQDNMGDSYQKVRAADIIIGFMQTEEEAALNQARMNLAKLRETAGKGFEFPMYVNLDLMLIAGLDEPNTQRVAALYHHATTPFRFEDEPRS